MKKSLNLLSLLLSIVFIWLNISAFDSGYEPIVADQNNKTNYSFISTSRSGKAIDLQKVQPVSGNKLLNDDDNSRETKRPTDSNSIYVQAFTNAITRYPQRGKNLPGEKEIRGPINFNLQDRNTGKKIRFFTMLEAHVACADFMSALPRFINDSDETIFIDDVNYKLLLQKRYKRAFGYDVFKLENIDPATATKSAIKRAERRLAEKYADQSKLTLREKLFENPTAIKLTNCRYRELDQFVTIYYHVFEDLFAVVDPVKNQLLDFDAASETDYVDIFRFRCLFLNPISRNSLIGLEDPGNPFIKLVEFQLGDTGNVISESKLSKEKFSKTFDNERDIGLPKIYDPVEGWWPVAVQSYLRSFDSVRYAELSVEKESAGPKLTNDTQIEAFTILQAEANGLISEPERPDKSKFKIEADLDFDFKVYKWDGFPQLLNMPYIYVDIKSPLDPAVKRARGLTPESLEIQADNIIKSILVQVARAEKNNTTVVHIITLLRIKPSDRVDFLRIFMAKTAESENIDFNKIRFVNTSPLTIISL